MTPAFHLEVGEDHLATLTFDLPGRRANIFTREALAELEQLADLARERVVGERLGQQMHVVIEPPLVEDGIA